MSCSCSVGPSWSSENRGRRAFIRFSAAFGERHPAGGSHERDGHAQGVHSQNSGGPDGASPKQNAAGERQFLHIFMKSTTEFLTHLRRTIRADVAIPSSA